MVDLRLFDRLDIVQRRRIISDIANSGPLPSQGIARIDVTTKRTSDEDIASPETAALYQRTPGEELWLWRRRNLSPSGRSLSAVGSGMSQAEAALRLGITHQRYHDAEVGRLPERDVRLLLAMVQETLPLPTTGELCYLARRRSGRRLLEIRKDLGISRVSYLKWECVGNPDVVAYWRKLGFIFNEIA